MKSKKNILSIIAILMASTSCNQEISSSENISTETKSEQVSSIVSSSSIIESKSEISSTESSESEVIDDTFFETYDVDLTDYSYYTSLQKSYLSEEIITDLYQSKYGIANKSLEKPNKIRFDWYYEGNSLGSNTLLGFDLYFDTNKDFTDAYIINCGKIFYYEVTNFLFNTTYYWKVIAHTDNKDYESDVKEFVVENTYSTFRNLDIDNVANFRDLGGYKIDDTHRVKYGLVYRGAQLQESASTYRYVTDFGINQLVNQLKIKTEVDLRLTRDITCPSSDILENVNYLSLPMEWEYYNAEYSPILYYPGNVAATKTFFETVANQNNLPLYFHCAIGTDRTGVLAFLLNGLLGVSVDDLHKDYLYSNMARLTSSETGNVRRLERLGYTVEDGINEIEGDTLQEKIEKYLLDIGVSKEVIANVKANLVEEI